MTIADVIPLFLQTTITIKVTTDEMRIAWRNRADRIDALAKSLLDEGRSNEKEQEKLKSTASSLRYVADHLSVSLCECSNANNEIHGYELTIEEAVKIGIIEPISSVCKDGRFGGCGC